MVSFRYIQHLTVSIIGDFPSFLSALVFNTKKLFHLPVYITYDMAWPNPVIALWNNLPDNGKSSFISLFTADIPHWQVLLFM